MRHFFTILGTLFAVLFAWAGYLQHNDPDATVWYAIYGLATLASILFALRRLHLLLAVVLGVIALVGAYTQWPVKFQGFSIGEGDIENIERAREAGGLLIIAFVMLIYAMRTRFEKKRSA